MPSARHATLDSPTLSEAATANDTVSKPLLSESLRMILISGVTSDGLSTEICGGIGS